MLPPLYSHPTNWHACRRISRGSIGKASCALSIHCLKRSHRFLFASNVFCDDAASAASFIDTTAYSTGLLAFAFAVFAFAFGISFDTKRPEKKVKRGGASFRFGPVLGPPKSQKKTKMRESRAGACGLPDLFGTFSATSAVFRIGAPPACPGVPRAPFWRPRDPTNRALTVVKRRFSLFRRF